MMRNAFYFTLKALFVLEKRLEKNAKVNFKIYDVKHWITNYSKRIAISQLVKVIRQNLAS